MNGLQQLLVSTPELALFMCLSVGFAIGRLRLGQLSLGGVAGTLLVSIAVGMSGAALHPQVQSIAFALFIFTLGYSSGPTFFSTLNRDSLRFAVFTAVEVFAVLGVTAGAAVLLKLDPGTAAGLMGGGATESAVIGTASDAIGKLPISADEIATFRANLGTAYSISYICGLISIVLISSQIAPLLFSFDLASEAQTLWKKLGGSEDAEAAKSAVPELVGRVFRVGKAAGKSVAQLEAQAGAQVAIEKVLRGSELPATEPELVLAASDLVLVIGRRASIVALAEELGEELEAPEELALELETADVIVDPKRFRVTTLRTLRERAKSELTRGVFLTGITRMDAALPLKPETEVRGGDVVHLTGAKRNVERIAREVGVRLSSSVVFDMVAIALGIVVGILIGKLELQLGSIPFSLGTGGGCLGSGLLLGWLRAKHPGFGQYHPAAASVVKELGLATFICAVGLSSGPKAVTLVEKYGVMLPLAAVLITAVPATLSLWIGLRWMKLAPPLALGAVAGQQCSTPAITAIQQSAGNSTPMMSYTVVYALSNVVLPLLGPVVVFMTHALTG